MKKKRAFIYAWKNGLRFYCHNCGANHSFYELLETLDPHTFDQYKIELFKEKYGSSHSERKVVEEFEPPKQDMSVVFEQNKTKDSIFRSICKPLTEVSPDNPAYQYCIQRKIPKIQLSRLFYIDDTTKLKQLDPDLDIPYGDERLVLPFFDKNGVLIGLTCRALNKKSNLRYLMVKLQDTTQVFGMDKVDPTKTIYVVEGPIDSLFLPNCIAVSGTAFGKVDSVLKDLNIASDQVVLIIDNQPRNKEVTTIQSRLIDLGYSMVIWDVDNSLGKDINDLIIVGGFSLREVHQIIKRCISRGLDARMRFNQWKKC